MAIPTFPTLPGLAFPVKKSPMYQSIIHESVSGVSTGQSTQPYPRYAFDLPFEFLRAASVYLELQTLMGFYQSCRGRAYPFHFSDPDDNAVVGQPLGLGDGVTTDFALLRSIGASSDPVQDAVAAGLIAYVNAVPTAVTLLTTSQYATIYAIRFAAAPGAGAAVTVDFGYNWLCRFDMDTQEFSKFLRVNSAGLFEAKSVKFTSVLQ